MVSMLRPDREEIAMQSAVARGWSDAALRLRARTVKPTSGIVLLIGVFLLLLGFLPGWPYSQDWGYATSATLGFVLLALVLLWLAGKI
jgi:hypothetical protein